ncbi:MAG: signal recognition particle-docking protein FtsY [Nanoarchaeota archaeon]|nr:signal recognition particle-docking protein FtsY [Nanoarchaeota archaeon]
MFGKLKDKLKSWIGKVSQEKEDETVRKTSKTKLNDKEVSTKKEKTDNKKKSKKESNKKDRVKDNKKDKTKIKPIEEHEFVEPEKKVFDESERKVGTQILKDIEKEIEKDIEKEEKKSFFKSVFSGKKMISSEDFKEYSEDLEMILLENNVALEIAEKIIYDLKEKIVGKDLEKKEIATIITKSLKEILLEVLVKPFDLIKEIEEKSSPYIILFCGVNGAGKTTTIAKFGKLLQTKKISAVFAAGDTFRAASIEQLKKHGEKLGINVINHEYGSDPAAVGYDAIQYAKKNKIKAVLIDTAGRMHTAKNLLREMEKIKRVCSPDRVIFLGEAITGNDSVEQVKAFDETIGLDGIILSKADIDEKGGTALSVGYITKKPILFLGTGQNYEDLEIFDKEKFIKKLGLD